jgi:Mn2+/Fe2+ NRAMP family transporter
MYTESLGQWSFYIVGIAAFTCMFSTTITCFDAYTRVTHMSLFLGLEATEERAEREGFLYWGIMAFFAVTTFVIIGRFMTSMVGLLTVATLLAFLSAPVLAYLNYRVITDPHVPAAGRSPKWLLVLAWAGLAFLTGFSVLFLYVKFVA